MENLLWMSIIMNGFGIFYILKISAELLLIKTSISEIADTIKEIDAKTDYVENIQDDVLALSEKIDPKDPDGSMGKV